MKMPQSPGMPTLFSEDDELPEKRSLCPDHQHKLWIAIHFPGFSFEALGAKHLDQPVVVTEVRDGQAHVIAVNDAAVAVGIRQGMRLSEAFELSATLAALERRLSAEQLKLEELAMVY